MAFMRKRGITISERNTKADSVYSELRRRIVEAELAPGEKLSEERIAGEFNVSRSPVKEALTRLAAEELVEIYPQVGSIVSPLSTEKYRDVLEMRLLLEPYTAERAALKVTDEALQELQALLDDIAGEAPGTRAYAIKLWKIDDRLHDALRKATGNREIDTLLEGYHSYVHRTRVATGLWADRLLPSLSEIRAIFDALKRRSPADAREAMKIHISNIRKAYEKICELQDKNNKSSETYGGQESSDNWRSRGM